MSRKLKAVPSYLLHRPSGQARVRIGGRDHYLGKHNSPESQEAYARLIAEMAVGVPVTPPPPSSGITVSELILAYWRFAETYYLKNGEPTGSLANIKAALRVLKGMYGSARADEFGPLSLKAVRQQLIEAGHSRGYINAVIARLCRMFKWAASEELVPVAVHQGLATVSGLRKGRSAAKEMPPVLPVDPATVDATLPYVAPIVADLIQLQRLTGMRPNEVCQLRPCDIDRSEDVWRYVPASHKTEHHGRERTIFVGPKAQAILRPYLLRPATSFCFSPAEAERDRKRRMREARKSRVQPSQADRSTRKPKRKPGECYDVHAYRRAIHRACDRAFPAPANIAENAEAVKAWGKSHRWSPNRLRHAAATEVRKQFGLEAAQTVLGHASADVTQVYAERDMAKAAQIMREVG